MNRIIFIGLIVLTALVASAQVPMEIREDLDVYVEVKMFLLKNLDYQVTHTRKTDSLEYQSLTLADKNKLSTAYFVVEHHCLDETFPAIYYAQQIIADAEHESKGSISVLTSHIVLGRLFRNYDLHEKAIEHYEEALSQLRMLQKNAQLIREKEWVNFLKYQTCQSLAKAYHQTDYGEESEKYYQEAITLLQGIKDSTSLATMYLNIGRGYVDRQKKDSALIFFQTGLVHWKRESKVDTKKHIYLLGEIASYYYDRSMFDSALHYGLRKHSLQKGQGIIYTTSGLSLARTYLSKGQTAKAEKLINEVYIREVVDRKSPTAKATYYELKKEIAKNRKNIEQYIAYSDSFNKINADIRQAAADVKANTLKQLVLSNKTMAGERMEYEKARAESLNQKNRNQRLIFIIIGLVIIFSAVMIITTFRRRLIRSRERQELLRVTSDLTAIELRNKELEEARLQQEIELKQKDITDLAMNLNLRQEIITEVIDKLGDTKRASSEEIKTKVDALMLELMQKLQEEDKAEALLQNVELVNHQFYARLNEIVPGLTKAEKELCAFIRMGLGNKEIAAIKKVTGKSLKTLRYRLRKKLPLAEEQSEKAFIDGI